MRKCLIVCAAIFMVGCDSGIEESPRVQSAQTVKYFHKNTIYFPGGDGIEFSGILRNYTLISSDNGSFDRYVFEFSEDMMAVEGAVFATLAKGGYQRKVRREDDKLFVVNYIKKGFAPVSMTYERIPAKADVQAFTRLKVTWKNA